MLPNVPWSHVPPTGLFLTPKTLFSRATHTHKQDSQPGAAWCQSLPSTKLTCSIRSSFVCWYLMTEPITPSKEHPKFRLQEGLKFRTKNNRGRFLSHINSTSGWLSLSHLIVGPRPAWTLLTGGKGAFLRHNPSTNHPSSSSNAKKKKKNLN